MSARSNWFGFYFITDENYSTLGFIEDVRLALEAGVSMVQYRRKGTSALSREETASEAHAVLSLCKAAGVPLIVNDDTELALVIGADGLHVGPHDLAPAEARRKIGPDAILGVSVASPEEAIAAAAAGADYVAASPIHLTPTKQDTGAPVGMDGLRAIRQAVDLPLVAIGGINMANVREIGECGAAMFCAISASYRQSDFRANIARLSWEFRSGYELWMRRGRGCGC